jgi:hypothetical protein
MQPGKRATFPPVTLGHIRGHGSRSLLVYCGSIAYNYGAVMRADHLPDDTPIRPLGDHEPWTAQTPVRVKRGATIKTREVGSLVRCYRPPAPLNRGWKLKGPLVRNGTRCELLRFFED